MRTATLWACAPGISLLTLLLASGCPQQGTSPLASVAPTASGAPSKVRPRVVTAAPALAEMACAIDGQEHLIGVSSYCTYPASLSSLPQIGGAIDPNLEVIDGLAPDLVLLQGRHAGLEDLADRRPWRVELFRVERVQDVLSSLDRLGQLLGKPQAAARERARLEAALAVAKEGRPSTSPRVLLVFGRREGALTQLSCSGEGTFLSECLEAVGGTNCLKGLKGYPLVSTEVLVERAPDLIVELFPEPRSAEARAALRADWQALPSIPAVSKGRIAIVSGAELLLPGPRLDKTLAKLARVIAGELDVE
ncbi:MAG: ABC transporter substrate-binding protein [Planctomycetes bacterium]|nr:ABC transporter substrate-binding protein [Planctomycetota bacterium]